MRAYLRVLRRHVVFVTVCGLFAAGGTALYVHAQPTRYEAMASVQIYNLSSPLQTRGGQSDLTRAMLTQISIVRGDAVRTTVRAAVGSAPSVDVHPEGDADVLDIVARAATAARAAAVANAYADAYVQVGRVRAQDTTNRLVDTLTQREEAQRQELDGIDAQLKQSNDPSLRARRNVVAAQLASLIGASGDAAVRSAGNSLEASVIRTARPPRRPSRTSPLLLVGTAAVVSLLVGYALACVFEARRHRQERGGFPRRRVVPVLGPVSARRLTRLEPAQGRQIRRLCDELGHEGALSHSVVQVTGISTAEPVGAVAAQVAIALARAGRAVALVDCDISRPQLQQLCEVPLSPGLSEAVTQGLPVDRVLNAYRCGDVEVGVVTAGQSGPRTPPTAALREFVAELLADCDVCVLVTAPRLPRVPRALSVPAGLGATVVVADEADVGGEHARSVVDRLTSARAHVAAIIAVHGRPPPSHNGYAGNTGRALASSRASEGHDH